MARAARLGATCLVVETRGTLAVYGMVWHLAFFAVLNMEILDYSKGKSPLIAITRLVRRWIRTYTN